MGAGDLGNCNDNRAIGNHDENSGTGKSIVFILAGINLMSEEVVRTGTQLPISMTGSTAQLKKPLKLLTIIQSLVYPLL